MTLERFVRPSSQTSARQVLHTQSTDVLILVTRFCVQLPFTTWSHDAFVSKFPKHIIGVEMCGGVEGERSRLDLTRVVAGAMQLSSALARTVGFALLTQLFHKTWSLLLFANAKRKSGKCPAATHATGVDARQRARGQHDWTQLPRPKRARRKQPRRRQQTLLRRRSKRRARRRTGTTGRLHGASNGSSR